MAVAPAGAQTRRPRFRRATEPPPFRLTDSDVEIVRVVARHRLIRSTHIAALIGRSLDRTNDRLMRLFHAGYVDRPRAQLDYYPTAGSAPMVYALADRGMHLLSEWDGVELRRAGLSRSNREAGRPFIEHQIEIVNFQVALEQAVRERGDIRLLLVDDMIAGLPDSAVRNPFALRAQLSHRGLTREVSVIPDFVFALQVAKGARRNFMVEVDRGTMPVTRSDPDQTSFARKMRVYVAAHAAKQHHRLFGWQNFRVLIVTTERRRIGSMMDAARQLPGRRGAGPSLFQFGTFQDLRQATPLSCPWLDGEGRPVHLI
jgi:Replication-relaxation